MATRELPDSAELNKRLRYDAITGKLYWRPKDSAGNAASLADFNRNRAGKEAGSVSFHGYVVLGFMVNGAKWTLKAHRIIWCMVHGEWPDGEIDHINGDRIDNRIVNLRVTTRGENRRNSARSISYQESANGVKKKRSRYTASVRVAGKLKSLGAYDTLEAAAHVAHGARLALGYTERHGK